MTEAKALKLTRKVNDIIRELNDYNEAKSMAAAAGEPSEMGDDGLKPRIPCTTIINGYVYKTDCKTGEIVP